MKPHIVFITTDTQGSDMISAYGRRPGVDTPCIDRLAEEGVLFENAFTASPVCTPARSAWFTGLYPNRNGALTNEVSIGRQVPILAEELKKVGYQTHHFGKWHLDSGAYEGRGVADGGFDSETWYDLKNFIDEVGREGANKFGAWNKGWKDESFCFAHRVADRAIAAMQGRGQEDRPGFFAIEFDEPHGPYICPPPFRDRFRQEDIEIPDTIRQDLSDKPRLQQEYSAFLAKSREDPNSLPDYYFRYYNCNSYVDYEIGRVIEEAKRALGENTLFIFTSDHGDHQGSFGLCAKGPTMYERTIKVPLVVAGALVEGKGRRVDCMTSGVDVWATVMDAAGVNPPADRAYAARSFLPVLRGVADDAGREDVIVEYNRFGQPHKQCDGFFPIRCVRTKRWKLSINLFDTDELYDLEADPQERRNLIGESAFAKTRDQLHDRILDHMEATQDLLRGPAWLRRPWREDADWPFEGLHTTGYIQEWEFGRLADPIG